MTDKEKLEKLFQAALSDPSVGQPKLKRAFPAPVPAATAEAAPAAAPAPAAVAPAPVVVEAAPAPRPGVLPLVEPMPNAGLDEATSAELGALLDQQMARKKRQRRRELLATAAAVVLVVGGGAGWFASSPERMVALRDAVSEIRSAGDVMGMVRKYQAALDKIAVRGQQIDDASREMGVDPASVTDEDPYMEAEMEQMTRGEGPTVGARNRKLRESFGHMETGAPALPAVPRS